jgi:hypothetical protein
VASTNSHACHYLALLTARGQEFVPRHVALAHVRNAEVLRRADALMLWRCGPGFPMD